MSKDESEVRVTGATGGAKGSKDRRYDLVPVGPMDDVARLYAFGAKKYAAHNWRKGYDWHLSYAAAQRHLTQFWNGEDVDEETGLPHLAAVVFHSLALMEFAKSYPQGDNRPPPSGTLYVEEPERKHPEHDGMLHIPPVGSVTREGYQRVPDLSTLYHGAGKQAYWCGKCNQLEREGYTRGLPCWDHGAHCPLFMDGPVER